MDGEIAERYRDFATYARDDSPTFEAWARAVADDPVVHAWLADLPEPKQQPNLVFAAARWHGALAPGSYAGLKSVLITQEAAVKATVLRRATQTNEVGRLATLTPVMAQVPGPLAVTAGWTVPESELSWRFSRSGGPGGQSVNTSDSRAELSFDVARSGSLPEHQRERALSRLAGRLVSGVVTVAASEHRSQLQNRDAAEQRLAHLLREAVAPPPAQRRPTRPTRGSKERRLEGKRQRSQVKRDRGSRGDE